MTAASLKLIDTRAGHHDSSGDDTLRFERRRTARHSVLGRATALEHAAPEAASTARIYPLELRNISDSGLAAVSEEFVEPGSAITVFFTPHSPESGFEAIGRVVRCRALEHGHELGIRFETRPAA